MRLLLLCLALFAAVGCASRSSNRWTGHKSGDDFTVLFAPVDTTLLATVWPDAGNQFAFDLANRVDILGKDANGWASESLPVSSDKAWTSGTVAGAAGADWIVLTKITALDLGPSPLGPQWVAKAEMQALDAHGKAVFLKTTHGTALKVDTPKQMSPDGKPESIAAWGACTNAVSALIEALRLRQELPTPVAQAPEPALAAPAVPVIVTVTSIPDHADVLVDGKFRGTTPLALTLTSTPVLLRIERQGFQPWQREVTPSADMQVSPALEVLSQAAPATPPVSAPQAQPAAAPAEAGKP